jgi:hypothetical protein
MSQAAWTAIHDALGKAASTRTAADQLAIKKFATGISGRTVDINRELGLEAKKVKRTRQLQAFEDPTTYKTDRDTRYDEMSKEIERVYFMIYDQMITSGSTEENAMKEAKTVAKAMMEAQEKAIEVEFNMDTKVVDAASRLAKVTGNKVGLTTA